MKRLPAPGRLSQRQRAAVGDHDRARDGEAEAGAAGLARARGVQSHEGLEDPLGVGGRDADAGVLHGERRVAAVASSATARPCPPPACT